MMTIRPSLYKISIIAFFCSSYSFSAPQLCLTTIKQEVENTLKSASLNQIAKKALLRYKETIKKTFTTLRDYSPKVAHFWKLFLDIPESEILCLQKPYRKMRKSHWPF